MTLFYRVLMLMQLEQSGRISKGQVGKELGQLTHYEFVAPWSPEWRRIALTNEWREAVKMCMGMLALGNGNPFAALGRLEKRTFQEAWEGLRGKGTVEIGPFRSSLGR